MSDPILLVENLIQRYDGGFRLRAPRFAVYPGRAYAVTGPNGSGKTTLLRTLACLMMPAAGTMTFDGVAITDDGAAHRCRRQVTLVMQDAYLFRNSVFDNVAYGLRVRSVPEDTVRSRVHEMLEAVGLSTFGAREAHKLSCGEAQRVALARALVLEPRLLLLDEPTASVDAANAEAIERIVGQALSSRNMAVVFSTHQLEQAYRMADEIMSLRDGVMLDAGPTNLFTGDVEHGAEGATVRLAPEVAIQVTTPETGRIHVRIPPEDVIISRAPLQSSARNSFPGTIVSAVAAAARIRLDLDIGIRLTALITKKSFGEMRLNIGDTVYATFKTSAVQVF